MMSSRIRVLLSAALVVTTLCVAAQPAPSDTTAQQSMTEQVAALRQQLQTLRDGPQRYRALRQISQALRLAQRLPESWAVLEEIVRDEAIGAGRRSLVASDLALLMATSGDHAKSRGYLSRAKTLARAADPAELEGIDGEPAYRHLHAEAEIARRAEFRHEVAMAKMRERMDLAWLNFNDAGLSERRRRAAANEMFSGVVLTVLTLAQNNRPQEALGVVQELFDRIATHPGLEPSKTHRGALHTGMAIALASLDNYEAALEASSRAVEQFESAGESDASSAAWMARRVRLHAALALGRLSEFGDDLRLVSDARGRSPVIANSFVELDSLVHAAAGRWKDAAANISALIDTSMPTLGPENPFVRHRATLLMLYRLADASDPPSTSAIDRFVTSLSGGEGDWADARFRGAYVDDGALAAVVHHLLRAGPGAAETQLAFRASELLRLGASQGALADGAARLAAGDSGLRALVEREQLQRFERTTHRRTLFTAEERAQRLKQAPGADELVSRREAADVEAKRATLADAEKALVALRREIASRYPVYRELVNPRIPSTEQVGSLLRADEAYVGLHAGIDSGYAFVIRPGGQMNAVALPMTRRQTRQLVTAFRKPFDTGIPPHRAGDLAGLDLAAAHALFKGWIEPLQPLLGQARTVYLAAGGVLNNLPWEALPVRPASDLASTAWWGDAVSVIRIPSASALMLVRGATASRGTQPFIGFADPAFDDQATDTQVVANNGPGVRQRMTSLDATAFDYRTVPRLPETLDESLAMARVLGAKSDAVIQGTAATRSRVLKEDLSRARVVAFATHGVIPGEVPGLRKAGLAMAYEGRGLEDSLLTLDEIVGLRLNADWVVLSACNTGRSTDDSGDAYSALMRGFFAAGARTVAATQWAVESNSAKQLMVSTFSALADDPRLSKAQALSGAQRAMRAGRHGDLYRHPYFWAPYFLAGDASR